MAVLVWRLVPFGSHAERVVVCGGGGGGGGGCIGWELEAAACTL